MSNRRVKNIAYDDDDMDDYEDFEDEQQEEQALSSEDREQMQVATREVRKALGPEFEVPESEIHETLYYYYFDVEKTLAYIKSIRKPKATKKPVVASSHPTSQQKSSTIPKKAPNGVPKPSVPEEVVRRRKSIDVLDEFRKSPGKKQASFVVVGHVDHGKSTLMGRLLLDLKITDQRSLDKLQKEADIIGKSSFALAWVMDETSEERSSGITVGFATKHFETEKTRFTILDAPGHQDFIPNMIAGASQADFAVLVTDAATNSFESGLRGQTKEHALLVRSIGIQRLVVAINKMDMTAWSKERFEEIGQQMMSFLLSAGFQAKNINFVPCAGLTGANVAKPLDPMVAPWYHGGTLVAALEAFEQSTQAIEAPLRMTVADTFRATGSLFLTGRIDAGHLQVGDRVTIMPSGETTSIKALEVDNDSAEWAVAGQIVTLSITDLDPAHLRAGDVVCATSKPIENIKSFTVKVLAFQHIIPMLSHVHRGSLDVPARITTLQATLNKSTGEVEKKKPRVIQPGTAARILVELDAPAPLEKGNKVVLRAEGNTVAAGLIE